MYFMASQVAVIKALVKALVESKATSSTGEAALTPFLRTLKIDNYSTLKDKFYSAKSGYSTQDFLEQVCGVRRNNTDTRAITGSDAGGSVTKTAESIIPESSTAKTPSSSEYNSFTKNGLTVNITYDESSSVGSEYNYEVDNYINQQKLVVKKLYNWWIPEALDLINQSLGVNFSDGRANCTTLEINFSNNSSYAITWNDTTDMGKSSTMSMTINMSKLSEFTESDKNGTLSSTETDYDLSTTYLDRILLPNLAFLVLRANIPYFYNLPKSVQYGLSLIVGGYDDSNYYDSGYVSEYGSYDDDYKAYGYTMLRWLAKNYADSISNGLEYNSAKTAVTVTSDYSNATLNSTDYESTVVTITGSSLSNPLYITGNAKANVIVGTKGADTINGGKGNDTLTGGGGRDVFIYTSGDGNDVITDYTANQDSIRITSGSITSSSLSGSDVILKVGTGSIKVKNGKNKTLTLINSSGKTSTTIVGGSSTSTASGGTSSLPSGLSYADSNKTLNVKSPFTGTIDLSKYVSTVTTVNASTDTKFVSIKGTNRAENIKAGTRGSSIVGGKGNDTLTGGKGADIFSYANGDGKDVIVNFAPDYDTIKITSGAISKASISGSNVVLSVGSGSITINNAKGKDINITDKNGVTKTYNFTKTVTNPTTSSYEERWFAEDDNFGIDSQLDSIVKTSDNDYSVGNVSLNDISEFANNVEKLVKITQSNDK